MIRQGQPTVGDTITIVRRVHAAVGAVIDARPPADSSIATLVAPPILTREGDSVRVAYTIAVWSAGHNDVIFPGVVVVDQRGHVDTLADSHVAIDVRSVLPSGSTATIAPHPARPWLVRGDVSLLPFVVLLPLVLILLAAVQWWWRRPGPVAVESPAVIRPVTVADARITGWLAAGEARLALEHLEAELRDRPELVEWRARVAQVRFAEGNAQLVDELVREGQRLAAASSDR